MKNRNYLFAVLFFLVGSAFAQQEIQYSQNILNSHLLINPAYSGIFNEYTAGIKYRNQWDNLPKSPKSFLALGEIPIKDNFKLGIGMNYDQIGINTTNAFEVNPSVQIRVNEKSQLSFGLKAGIHLLQSDFTELVNVNLSDPAYADDSRTSTFLGFGALYFNSKYYIGISSPRVINIESTSGVDRYLTSHYYMYGGTKIKLEQDLDLRPQLLFKTDTKSQLVMEISSQIWLKDKIGFGLGYRSGDAVSTALQLKLNRMVLGYSFDFTTSRLQSSQNGTHELFIGFRIKKKVKKTEEEDLENRSENQRYF